MKSLIVIDNEVCEVESIHDNYVDLDNGNSYYIFETREDAGKAAKEHYETQGESVAEIYWAGEYESVILLDKDWFDILITR